ncbi:DUF2252 domain-containing protein [Gulbenkiania mobilis]|uniref:Uncharacterized protein (DUF2252 family) n=1 Tax=Gulbenkiania mobilis TaxID=397457 RepID=A0ABY2CZ81_GULMO|nr:uncharacterized protein (DUF2252 family) [Gulbenkiania mobilis]
MDTPHPHFERLYAAGKARRKACSRSCQARFDTDRPDRDVIAMLRQSSEGRVPALIPVRYGRMQVSPSAFFRGLALVQAADLAAHPHSGITVQACGDAHLLNYGFFASPERTLLFDLNDLDETHPAPWEWDLKRLAVSLALAARECSLNEDAAREAVRRAVANYRARQAEFARMGQMALWYSRISHEALVRLAPTQALQDSLERLGEKARNRTHERLLPKLAEDEGGSLRLKDDPPVLFHVHEEGTPLPDDDQWLATGNWHALVEPMMTRYLATLKDDRRMLVERFRLVDMAFKVVGVGSVGTRCLVILLQDDYDQPLFLQLKEARRSVLEPYTQPCVHAHQGRRVVAGQQLLQAASDLFLGWTSGPGEREFYVRQLRDMKASANLEQFDAEALASYGEACAWALARAHAKGSGRAAEIAGYLGQGEPFDEALTTYALGYADQVEADFAAFRQAIRAGTLPAETVD